MASLTKLEELRFLSLWELLKESMKVLRSHTKLFIYLTLTLIVPLCVVGLGHSLITQPIRDRIDWDEIQLIHRHSHARERRINRDIHKEVSKLFDVLAIYILMFFAFSLLSTSAIIYSVACIYSEKITSYKIVLSVVPRVWKRLIVTFLWAGIMMVGYVVLSILVFDLFREGSNNVNVVYVWACIWMVGFFVGAIYLSCVWHLASVVTVLEEGYGLEAMSKSLKLIKGKQLVALRLFLMYSMMAGLIGMGFMVWVVNGRSFGVHSVAWRAVLRCALGCALIVLLSLVDLIGLLVQTVFYFACKGHHDESIDRLQLSDHLGAYMGEYVLLPGSIQLQYFEGK